MKPIFLLLLLLAACEDTSLQNNDGCTTEATVKKLELDGCGFVFQLKDGSYLIPEIRVYVQAPKQSEDPVYYYTFVDGAKVKINYQEVDGVNACMAGKMVFVTCLTPLQGAD